MTLMSNPYFPIPAEEQEMTELRREGAVGEQEVTELTKQEVTVLLLLLEELWRNRKSLSSCSCRRGLVGERKSLSSRSFRRGAAQEQQAQDLEDGIGRLRPGLGGPSIGVAN